MRPIKHANWLRPHFHASWLDVGIWARQLWLAVMVIFVGWLCGLHQPAQAAVTLISFKAEAAGQNILVDWETASEVHVSGFFLTRSLEAEGPFGRVSPFIPVQGGTLGGAYYDFTDSGVVKGQDYYYQLQSIHDDQSTEFSETIRAGLSLPTATLLPPVATHTKPGPTPTPTSTHPAPTATLLPTRTPEPEIPAENTPPPEQPSLEPGSLPQPTDLPLKATTTLAREETQASFQAGVEPSAQSANTPGKKPAGLAAVPSNGAAVAAAENQVGAVVPAQPAGELPGKNAPAGLVLVLAATGTILAVVGAVRLWWRKRT